MLAIAEKILGAFGAGTQTMECPFSAEEGHADLSLALTQSYVYAPDSRDAIAQALSEHG